MAATMSTGSRAAAQAGPRARGRPARLRRRPAQGYAAGVCAGLGEYFNVDPLVFRIAFGLLAAFGGAGVGLYVLAWALVPADGAALREGQAVARFLGDGAWREAAGIALLVLAGLLFLRQLGLWPGDAIVWPIVLGSSGLALVARQAWGAGGRRLTPEPRSPRPRAPSTARAAVLPSTAGDSDPGSIPGGLVGAALIVGGALVFLQATGTLHALRQALVGIVVVVVVLGLVFGPWMVRQARALAAERAERIRSQERAEVAAHLHDSVLQTLALIQRRAGDPRTVSTLARRQERELRRWLSGDAPAAPTASLSAALRAAGQEIEELHGVDVEVVTVGDCPLDERLGALVQAAREALANAARFSGAEKVDLYAEVGEAGVSAFVRDRGVGFDPADVPPDRRGVRESIIGRMERHKGRARVESAPDEGTEVQLTMERAA
jgi:signal transduction histidine kinase/phage shock protein PspC (stress-responsive transcriptional regulator)